MKEDRIGEFEEKSIDFTQSKLQKENILKKKKRNQDLGMLGQ